MHWLHGHHDRPHSLPPNSPQSGAQWTPNIQPYDRDRHPYPQLFSPEEKEAQVEAGDRLREEFDAALRDGRKEYTIPPGLYRIKEPLIIEKTEGLVVSAADVELIVTENVSHFRILENRDLTVRGLTMDADPLGFTQGEIIDLNQEELTIDVQLFEGYCMPEKAERIEIFTPDGVMLPHTQDNVQECTDLGGGVLRIKMNNFTWAEHAGHADEVLRRGHLIAVEIGNRGGLEMRSNTNTTWEDCGLNCHALTWAGSEFGEDRFVRWRGSRKRDTNRLVGGGYPLMTFHGGAYSLIDSEIGHNFDDITDINTFESFAFHQVGPRQFHIMSEVAQAGWPITLHDYKTMECYCECTIEDLKDVEDPSVREMFTKLAEKYNVRDLDTPRLATISCDIEIPELTWICLLPVRTRSMRFEHNYLHDGLAAGVAAKGADEVIIRDNIVERIALRGIAVCFDPYWWEGTPSRNIEIVGNTVRNCAYAPGVVYPAVSVFVGGSFDGMPGPDGTAQLQQGILIANNAIYSAGAGAIAVTNSRDITITANTITDSDRGAFGMSSIYVDAVSEGTRIAGNLFVGSDAGSNAVQIQTGPHNEVHTIYTESNQIANPEVPMPSQAWKVFPILTSEVELSGEGWREEDRFPYSRRITDQKDAAASFKFYGSRVRARTLRAPWTGLVDVFIDGRANGTVDTSMPDEEHLGSSYVSPVLPLGEHTLRLVNRAEPGEAKERDGGHLVILGFDVLAADFGGCQWDPAAEPPTS